jgi:hypothetical protein
VAGIHINRQPWPVEIKSGAELAKIPNVVNPVNDLDPFLVWHKQASTRFMHNVHDIHNIHDTNHSGWPESCLHMSHFSIFPWKKGTSRA